MKKSVDTTAAGPVITTTNGLATATTAFFVKDLKEYPVLENGFRRSLVDEIIGQIADSNGALWNQAYWRAFTEDQTYGGHDTLDEVVSTLAPWLVTAEESHCGVQMCIAGWASELVAADWLVDARAWKEHRGWVEYNISDLEDKILVRRDDPLWEDYSSWWSDLASRTDVIDNCRLIERGFSGETHKIANVDEFAHRALGLDEDPFELFEGDNNWWRILGIIDAYTEFGPRDLEADEDGWLRWRIMADGYSRWYDRTGAEEIRDALADEGVGTDYHREHAPSWALERAGMLAAS